MNDIVFDWDKNKDAANKRKHQISFDEAKTVFFDMNAIRFPDVEHSIEEERFIILGLSVKIKVLVVVHCFRDEDSTIRIISARKATKREASYYQKNLL